MVYRETIERVLTNILVFMDVMRPRNFDAQDLQRELPIDQTYIFWHANATQNCSEPNKLLIKDFKDEHLQEARENMAHLFKLLDHTLRPMPLVS